MVIYFISALLISFVLFKLGSYATIISLMATVGKVFVGLTVIGVLFLFYKRYKGTASRMKLLGRK
jgi:hypothetical protein